jgi:hypothetical protein
MKVKKDIQLEKNKGMLWNQSDLNLFLSWQFWKLAPTTFPQGIGFEFYLVFVYISIATQQTI